MADVYNTSSVNSELFVNLLADARFAAAESSIARQITTVFPVANNQGKVVQVPLWAGATAVHKTEGTALEALGTNTTSATITMEEYAVYHSVSDMLRDSAAGDVMANLGTVSGNALGEKMDSTVFATFDSFTGGTLGAEGTELTEDLILKAAATLRANKLTGPFYAVVDPRAAYNLKARLGGFGQSTTSFSQASSNVGMNVQENFFIGSISGVQIFESSLVDSDTTELATCGVFAPSAIGVAVRGDVEMETQRDAKNSATDMVMRMTMGASAIQPTHGVKLLVERNID